MALDKDKWNNFCLTIERFRRRHKLSDITIGDLSKLQNPNKKRSYDAIADPRLVRRLVRRLTYNESPSCRNCPNLKPKTSTISRFHTRNLPNHIEN